MLTLGIEARYLLSPRTTGVEQYAAQLIRALCELPGDLRILLYLDRRLQRTELPWLDDPVRTGRAALRVIPPRRLWYRVWLPRAMGRDRVEIAFFPGTILPSWPPWGQPFRTVAPAYDLCFLTHPEDYAPADLKAQRESAVPSLRRADLVLAISKSTRQAVVQALGVPEDRVVVTPLAAGPEFQQVAEPGPIISELTGSAGRFLLAAARLDRRKNLVRVVEAYGQCRRDSHIAEHLLMVGPPGNAFTAIQRTIHDQGLSGAVHVLGHQPPEVLAALYSAATGLVFPSLCEGFGLPILEAMACGCSVITSNGSAMAEVAGQAALRVDPESVPEIAAAMGQLASDEALRDRLRELGHARAARFTWEATARATLDAMKRLAQT
jgi:glycosyltransferase involved in cell wall biosynthesis